MALKRNAHSWFHAIQTVGSVAPMSLSVRFCPPPASTDSSCCKSVDSQWQWSKRAITLLCLRYLCLYHWNWTQLLHGVLVLTECCHRSESDSRPLDPKHHQLYVLYINSIANLLQVIPLVNVLAAPETAPDMTNMMWWICRAISRSNNNINGV